MPIPGRIGKMALALALTLAPAFGQAVSTSGAGSATFFAPNNLVVAVEGCGNHGGTCTSVSSGSGIGTLNSSTGGYGDNQAAPLTLFQYSPSGTASVSYVNSLVLPQTGSGSNFPISGEYGSSSEGGLQLSGTGQYLTIMGYGINASMFDAAYNPLSASDPYGALPSGALAQSGSLTGQSYAAVPRVVTLIDANGNVNSATPVYNIFNTNNPRSIYTATGAAAYVSGQGSGCDATGGVFYIPALGAANTSPIAITGLDASGANCNPAVTTISQDTRALQIYNNTLYVANDTKEGTGSNRSFIGTLGTAGTPPTSLAGAPVMLTGYGNAGGTGKVTITSGATSNGNNLNNTNATTRAINLSPVNYFFASPTVLYVTDSGHPKNDSNGDDNSGGTANIGDGGLQKWVNTGGTWALKYTLYQGLNLVNNGGASGTTGLYGLAGVVNGSTVNLYVTNYTINDLDTTYLYGVTDTLANTTPPGTTLAFTLLDTAPADSNFKGVSFTPSIPAGSVEVTSAPSGISFSVSGTGCGSTGPFVAPVTLAWTPASSCTLSVATPQAQSPAESLQTAPTGIQYAFANWEDNTTALTHTVTAPANTATYTATFATQYQLTNSAGTGGSVSAGGYYTSGTNATITATPNAGYYFVNFTGATTSTSNPLIFDVTAPSSITANFAAQTTPTVSWTAPAAITYGSALSSIQLDATASVPGTFVYTPAAGTVLPVGSGQTLSVAFTPTDTVHYTGASGSTTITVNPASAPASPANLVLTKTLTRSGGNVNVVFTIANIGGTDATNVTLTSVKVGADIATPLPQTVGTVAAGTSASATVSVPASVGASGAASSLTAAGTYTGGTFSSSARITLP